MPSRRPSPCSTRDDRSCAPGHGCDRSPSVARRCELVHVDARRGGDLLPREDVRLFMSRSPMIPASTRITPTPCSRTRSRRKAYSWPFVSSVPSSTTVFSASVSNTLRLHYFIRYFRIA